MTIPAHAQAGGGETNTDQPNAQRLERVELTARPQTTTELRKRSTAAKQIYDEEEIQKFDAFQESKELFKQEQEKLLDNHL